MDKQCIFVSSFIKKWICPDKWHKSNKVFGPRNNWQWNKRGPVLGKSGIFSIKTPLKMDFKGMGH